MRGGAPTVASLSPSNDLIVPHTFPYHQAVRSVVDLLFKLYPLRQPLINK